MSSHLHCRSQRANERTNERHERCCLERHLQHGLSKYTLPYFRHRHLPSQASRRHSHQGLRLHDTYLPETFRDPSREPASRANTQSPASKAADHSGHQRRVDQIGSSKTTCCSIIIHSISGSPVVDNDSESRFWRTGIPSVTRTASADTIVISTTRRDIRRLQCAGGLGRARRANRRQRVSK